MNIKKIAVLTGGGDAPGTNACLYSLAKMARKLGYEIVGIRNGWTGTVDYFEKPLNEHDLLEQMYFSGTYIGTSRFNPFKEGYDKSQIVVDNLKKHNVDAVVTIGGEDTLGIANKLLSKYPNIVGVAKTMDNDLLAPYTLGFNTAVDNGIDYIEKIRTTAYSHDRVLICELMGRKRGWVALKAGVNGRADVILIPEVKADMDVVCETVKNNIEKRKANSTFQKGYSIVVVAEGFEFGENTNERTDEFGHKQLKGVGERIARHIEFTLKNEYDMQVETRSVKPEHSIRGGRCSWFDIDMGLKYGFGAMQYVKEEEFGFVPIFDMDTEQIKPMKIEDAIKPKQVPDHLIELYGNLVSFGA